MPIVIPELDGVLGDGTLDEVMYMVKSGKEATVYCCRGGARIGGGLVAAKVYRSRANRGFRNDAVYQDGRVILDKRLARAVKKKTDAGRGAQGALWVDNEYEVLKTLFARAALVPRPIARADSALLMEYVGDDEMAAPPLIHADFEREDARRIFDALMQNIVLWLTCNYIHADLSPFNVLYWNDGPVVIDFPQAVDARFNRHAFDLLNRDIANICDFFARHGIESEPDRISQQLWGRYKYADLLI